MAHLNQVNAVCNRRSIAILSHLWTDSVEEEGSSKPMTRSQRIPALSLSILLIAVAAAAVAYGLSSAPETRAASRYGTLVVTADACESLFGPLVPTAVVSVWHGSHLVARKEQPQGGHFTFRLESGSYIVTSLGQVAPELSEVHALRTTSAFLYADCGRLGQPAATATPTILADGRLASVVIVGNRDETLYPPPSWAAPDITREQALLDGTSSVGLGFVRPLDRHPTAIAYLAMLSELSPHRAAMRPHMVWIVEYPHTRFEPTGGPCCRSQGIDSYPLFLVVNPKTGEVKQVFGAPVRVESVNGTPTVGALQPL
jgi:hypothetical protein